MCQTSRCQTRGVGCSSASLYSAWCWLYLFCLPFSLSYATLLAFWKSTTVGITQGYRSLKQCIMGVGVHSMLCADMKHDRASSVHKELLFCKCLLFPPGVRSRPKALRIMCTFLTCVNVYLWVMCVWCHMLSFLPFLWYFCIRYFIKVPL